MNQQQLHELTDHRKTVGDIGEDFALRYERRRLQGHAQLQTVHVNGRSDIGLGYDILSFENISSATPDRYIEVKTYTGEPHFFLSQGEYAAAQKHGIRYYIYLIDITRIDMPGYEPIIIRDPVNSLSGNTVWNERIQNREYTLATSNEASLPADISTCTVLIGCFNSNQHLTWILHNHCYNVRRKGCYNGWQVNGGVQTNETTNDVRYLVLYNVCNPRTYSVYSVTGSTVVNRQQMLRMRYPSPHSNEYLLYHLQAKIQFPPLDIMQILRTNNDKIQRTSGTPIFLSGSALRRYVLGNTIRQTGAMPTRTFTNSGKPWTAVQKDLLAALYLSGESIAAIAHKLIRTPEEVHAQLKALKLE